jgi:hypothetical protein
MKILVNMLKMIFISCIELKVWKNQKFTILVNEDRRINHESVAYFLVIPNFNKISRN